MYRVNKSSTWLYKSEDLCGEVSDELLYGTRLHIISENGIVAYCKTEYDYYGFINKWDIEKELEDISKIYTVYSRCDILIEDKYRLAPYMGLSSGSKVELVNPLCEVLYEKGRFTQCIINNKKLYIPKYALTNDLQNKKATTENISVVAKKYLGTPYRWGGKSEYGIDCSGLVFMSCLLCGKRIYRDAVPCERYVDIIPADSVKCGDLAYFKGHVVIMLDGENFIHASGRYGYVMCDKFRSDYLTEKDVICFARIKE